jgi:outer membrane receptor for ferrienterochelin and colicins
MDNKFKFNNLDIKFGLSLLGKSDRFSATTEVDDEFLYKLNGTLGAYYNIEKYNASISLIHKFNGKDYEYIEDQDDGDVVVYTKITTDAYSWTDLSFKKLFFDKKLETTFGVRNLFNVTRVNKYGIGSGGETHGNLNNGLLLGYGRSYFAKLSYNLEIK